MLKRLTKRFIFLFIVVVALFLPTKISSQAAFKIIATSTETKFVRGVRHTVIKGEIEYNGVRSPQIINYTGANVKVNKNVKVVVGDSYQEHGLGRDNLRGQIYSTNLRYGGAIKIISGVNGDFFHINTTGTSVTAHVRDYEVIFPGTTYARTLVGFKPNGDVVHGKPIFTGYEVLVYDEDGALKLKQIKVPAFNRAPRNENEVIAYFNEYKKDVTSSGKKMVFTGIDVKSDGSGSRYFAKGKLDFITTGDAAIPNNGFVLVGESIFEEGLITETDTVVIQNVLGGEFADIRYAMGGYDYLVIDGEPQTSFFTDEAFYRTRAPRTAIGVKNDGTIFFVVVDGRQKPLGMEGVSLMELGEIMAYFGADVAVNVDGGGSSTIALYNEETDNYDILNSPSDGNLRSNANGMFFVVGELEEPLPPVAFPDLRPVLSMPENIYFTAEGNLVFEPVENALYYQILIDGKKKITSELPNVALDLDLGEYEVQVKAFGNHEEFRLSAYFSNKYFFLFKWNADIN